MDINYGELPRIELPFHKTLTFRLGDDSLIIDCHTCQKQFSGHDDHHTYANRPVGESYEQEQHPLPVSSGEPQPQELP